MRSLARSLWRLPAPPDAGPAGRLDQAFVCLLAVLAVLEVTVLRPDMHLRWFALAGFLVWLPTLLVRRRRPLVMVGVFVVAVFTMWLWSKLTGDALPDDLNTAVVGLLIPYSLARWARGQDAVEGLVLFASAAATSLLSQDLASVDRVGGTAVVIAAVAVGAALRSRSMLRTRQLDDVRQLERERLARDLHDTVAHHLTAIAISAQAGLAVAEREPQAARDALRRIDEEATRTLAETRKVVRMLRTEDAEAPERPLDDLAALAAPQPAGTPVDLDLADDLEALSPTIAAALHRIAQEAIANARRHARDATAIRVRISVEDDDVELVVADDGAPATHSAPGFGIVGMSERAALVGGTLDAGPAEPNGWQVRAVLPVEGVR